MSDYPDGLTLRPIVAWPGARAARAFLETLRAMDYEQRELFLATLHEAAINTESRMGFAPLFASQYGDAAEAVVLRIAGELDDALSTTAARPGGMSRGGAR